MDIDFHPLTLADRELVLSFTLQGCSRNCDLSFVNLMSWRFLYDTEVAQHRGRLVFRFKMNGHTAYLAPLGKGEWAPVIEDMMADSERQGHPFLMLGVTERSLTFLNEAMPDYFYATCDRDYSDYIYLREKLATLAGKKLQKKRNHALQFEKRHPDYEYVPLTPDLLPECRALEEKWKVDKEENSSRGGYENERRSLFYVLDHWNELQVRGGAIRLDGRIVAFTFGAPINFDTFDVCVEKADTEVDGAYAIINRDFVRSLPEKYKYINREEDLGVPGLRHAKLSYRPEIILHKFAVMAKHPFKS